jgi:hypothetical protein
MEPAPTARPNTGLCEISPEVLVDREHMASNPTSATVTRLGFFTVAALVCAGLIGPVCGAGPAHAQGIFNWPWEQPAPPKRPAPEWRPPPEPAAPPVVQGPLGSKAPICLQLEQRLVQESQRGGQSRDLLPAVEAQIRQTDQQLRAAASQLDRSNCYDYFLFSKTLRRTKTCIELSRAVDANKRKLAELEAQRNELAVSSGRSYQDEIIRELARNNCGATYTQQAARRDSNPFSSLWADEGESGPGGGLGGQFSALPYATYRTMCVRLCDGYYFPISFSTLPNHFERDAQACQSRCAAPTELFYYQNPGGAVEQMVGAETNAPYTSLKTAFRYRKEYVKGCSCRAEELNAATPGENQQGARPADPVTTVRTQAEPAATSGWSSETITP